MAEKREKRNGAEETERSSRRAGDESRRKAEAAADQTVEATAAASGAGERAMQQGSQSARQMAEHGLAAVRGAAERGLQLTGAGSQTFIEETTSHVGEMTERIAQSVQESAQDLRTLMKVSMAASGSIEELQQAAMGWMSRIGQMNAHAAQELFRYANPAAVIELQQRFARQYLHNWVEGGTELLRATHRLSGDALRPLQERPEMRRGGSSSNGSGQMVGEVMSPTVEVANPDQSIQEAARLMAQADTGALPVGENDRLVGMITDRDIAVRVTAEGRDPRQTRVRDVMTHEVKYVFEDEEVEHVAENMAEQQVRRMPVMNRDKRLVGVLSLGDISARHSPESAGFALRHVSRNGGSAHAGGKPGGQRRR